MSPDEKREAIRLAELAEIERQTRLREQPDPFSTEAHVDPATPTRLATFADDAEADTEAGGAIPHAPAAGPAGATGPTARHAGATAGNR